MSMHKIPLTELEQSGLEKHHLSTDKPSQLSDCFRLGVQYATQNFNETVVQLCKEKNALQAKIDSLMLEFCPEEMTQEQIENWEQHQVISTHSESCTNFLGTDISSEHLEKLAENSMDSVMNADLKDAKFSEIGCNHGREQKKTTPEFKQKMAEGFMFGANFMVVCPECGNKRCPKATNHLFKCTNSNEVGQVGEIDKELFNYDKLIITTGDDVSNAVWTDEKLEELQRVIDKINKEEQSSK